MLIGQGQWSQAKVSVNGPGSVGRGRVSVNGPGLVVTGQDQQSGVRVSGHRPGSVLMDQGQC